MDLPATTWAYIGIFSTALALILLGLLLWRRRELRRYRAVEAAAQLKQWGLESLGDLLLAYAVGNYFGEGSVTRITHNVIDLIQGEGVPALLRKTAWKMVEGCFLKDEEDRGKLKKLLEAAEAAPAKK